MQNSFSGGRSNIRNSDRKRSNKSHTFNICPQLPGHHTNHLSTQEIKSSQQNQSCIAMSVKRKSHYDLSIILDLFSSWCFFSLCQGSWLTLVSLWSVPISRTVEIKALYFPTIVVTSIITMFTPAYFRGHYKHLYFDNVFEYFHT